jgi:hypothetical protein
MTSHERLRDDRPEREWGRAIKKPGAMPGFSVLMAVV